MPANQTQRPKFYEEQYLGAADLTAAVDYSRSQQARHALGAHTWGIASGLQLKETPQPGGAVSVHLLPGYAWDGYGRPIVVLSPYKVPEEKFNAIKFDPTIDIDGKGRLIPVWLRYDESATRNPRPGFEGCETEDQRSRIQETFRIEIGEQPSTMDRYSGITIGVKPLTDAKTALQAFDATAPLVYDESIPHQAFPDSQARTRWLIPIGYVRWLPVQNQPGYFVARDDSGADKDSDKIRRFRRYLGVVAEEIAAADSVIRLRDRGKDPKTSFFQAPLTVTDPKNPPVNDLVWVEGNMRVVGDTRLAGGKLDFRDEQGNNFNTPLAVQRANDGSALRLVIGRDTQLTNRLAVGPLKTSDNSFDEKFVVLSNGNVGIGTSAPALKLEIHGADFGRDDGPATLHLWGSRIGDTGNSTLFVRAVNGGVVAFDGVNNRLGVGTVTPTAKVHVLNTTLGDAMAGVKLDRDDAGKEANLMFATGGNQNWALHLDNDGTNNLKLWGQGIGNFAMAWDYNTGNVGVGTSTPTLKLDIRGDFGRTDGAAKMHLWGSEVGDVGGGILFLRSGGGVVSFDGNDNVGVGTTTPSEKLHVQGNLRVENDLYVVGQAYKWNGFTWTVLSDEGLKEKITPLNDALSKLLQLHGVSFFWRSSKATGNVNGPHMGLIAQQVEKVFPEWVSTTPDGYKAVTMNGFEALTIEALRELRAEIETLKKSSLKATP